MNIASILPDPFSFDVNNRISLRKPLLVQWEARAPLAASELFHPDEPGVVSKVFLQDIQP